MNNIEDAVLTGKYAIEPRQELLLVRTANQCIEDAKTKPIPQKLFSDLLHEGELAILFADTNVGKSILAVQIADLISRGESDGIYICDAAPQKVLLIDFELSDKQFENRYSNGYATHYKFSDNLYRVNINPNYDDIEDFDQKLEAAIERHLTETGAKILIVDNITYLKMQSMDNAKEAMPLMKMLIRMKNKYGVTILALAHTPKRDQRNPITVNDLAGSKQLANFADSIFAIGQSFKDANLRYIKQLKARDTEKFYGADYVIVCKIEKNINFLAFNHVACESEMEHLKHVTAAEKDELDEQIIELKELQPEMSDNAIAIQLGTNHKKVGRVLSRNNLK